MFTNHKPGYVIKSTNYSPGNLAAAYNTDSGNIATKGDDQRKRHIIGINCSDHTANVRTQISVQSKMIYDIDHTNFANTLGPLDLDYELDAGQYLDIQPFNNTAGTITAPSWTIWYEVPTL